MRRIAVKDHLLIHEGDTLHTKGIVGTVSDSVRYHMKDVVDYHQQTRAAWVEARTALRDKLRQVRKLLKSDKDLVRWLAENELDLSAADVKRLLRGEPVT
jgi:hypothetical protein